MFWGIEVTASINYRISPHDVEHSVELLEQFVERVRHAGKQTHKICAFCRKLRQILVVPQVQRALHQLHRVLAVQMLKQLYEEEFTRALSQDEVRASFRVAPDLRSYNIA